MSLEIISGKPQTGKTSLAKRLAESEFEFVFYTTASDDDIDKLTEGSTDGYQCIIIDDCGYINSSSTELLTRINKWLEKGKKIYIIAQNHENLPFHIREVSSRHILLKQHSETY